MLLLLILGLFTAAWTAPTTPAPYHDPMNNEGLFGGDMLGVELDADKNAVKHQHQIWPGGQVPYWFDPSVGQQNHDLILRAMRHIGEKTCIRFRPWRNGDRDYIKIFKHNGCYAHWGKIGNEQLVSLGDGCHNFGIIIHELMHAIGFAHEHQRGDRDKFINIFWNNIEGQQRHNFEKLRDDQHDILSGFDWSSIMLYGSKSFAKPNTYSMLAYNGGVLEEVYNKKGLSEHDVWRIKKLYNCW